MAYEDDGKDGMHEGGDRKGGRRGPRKDFHSKDGYKGKGDSKPRSSGPRGDRKDFRKDGEKKDFHRSGDRKDLHKGGDRGSRPRGDRKRFSKGGDKRDFHKGGDRKEYRPRGDRKDSYPKRDREFRDEKAQEPVQEVRWKLVLPQDEAKMLSKGIDYQVKGDLRSALILFLHGSVMGSEGCENNAIRILRDAGNESFPEKRSDISKDCSEDALVDFDYICITLNKEYDRTAFDSAYDKGNMHAIFRKICLLEVEGDDPVIDRFAATYDDGSKKVMKALDLLKRKKDSEIAVAHIERIKERKALKQSIYTMFVRSMNGDAKAVKELQRLSGEMPDAAFYSEYISEWKAGNGEDWLKQKYDQYKDTIISKQKEFKIEETPFGIYLRAKNLESRNEEYMSVMMNAARAGSEHAINELTTKMARNDVKKCLAGIYYKNEDLPNLLVVYQSGLDDMYYLNQYCAGSDERIIEVGKEFSKYSPGRQIEWLKDHYLCGMEFCKGEILELSKDEFYQNKAMLYTLHDIGEDMEAAKLYFLMEDSPEAPSFKWLKKVCSTDEVMDFVRGHFEEKGDIATFDSIFEDDGYERRPRKKGGFGDRRSGKPRGRR